MKLKKLKPDTDAMVRHFVNMAKGNTAQGQQTIHRGLGISSRPIAYHMVPVIKAVTPTAQAVYQAKASVAGRDEESKFIRSQPTKKRKRESYHMPALD